MQAFEYAAPTSVEAAVALLGADSQVLAGGTDLVSLMKEYVVSPKRIVSLKDVKSLGGIEYKSSSGLRLGATVTFQELVDSPVVARNYPALVQAAEGVSSPQVRSRGTVAGDLCQRPRCWYFRLGYGLLAQMEGKALVPDGDNRYHAILGNEGPAYFVNPSSLAPILIALGAKVRAQGPQGPREISLHNFFKTPKSADEREYDQRSVPRCAMRSRVHLEQLLRQAMPHTSDVGRGARLAELPNRAPADPMQLAGDRRHVADPTLRRRRCLHHRVLGAGVRRDGVDGAVRQPQARLPRSGRRSRPRAPRAPAASRWAPRSCRRAGSSPSGSLRSP